MARHADPGRRRGVAPWLVVTAVVAVLALIGAVVWISVTDRDEDAAASCTGTAVLTVLSSPGATTGIRAAAAAFDATAPVARSACITTAVSEADAGDAAADLAGGWSGQDGPGPAVWVVDAESEVADAESRDPALTSGRDDRPEAVSPVVLAVRSADAAGLAGVTWAALPQSFTPGGSVSLVLPDPSTNRASSYALQSMVAGGTGTAAAATGTAPAVDGAAVTAATPALQAMTLATDPAGSTGSTAEALEGLQDGQALPVVESELVAWNRAHPDAPLTAVHPSGPVVGDTVLLTQLTAPWIDATAADAAGRFAGFLRGEAGRQSLADTGLRVDGLTPADPDPQVDQGRPVSMVAPAGPDITAQLVAALAG